MRILVTGAAGFIGFHLCKELLINSNHKIFGIDNLNDYYDVRLKKERLKILEEINFDSKDSWEFIKVEIEDKNSIERIFEKFNPEVVINLAAQAGVRYSLKHPDKYIKSNIEGFGNILECSRNQKIKHLIYASSSSVYGGNKNLPFSEVNEANHPVSVYAATKRCNELMAHSYSHLYDLPTTGLRFFTVYGPWGRPDMAYFIFTSSIIKGIPIKIFNNGNMRRDFTYIDDVVNGIIKLINKPPSKEKVFDLRTLNSSNSWAPYKIFNIGNSNPIKLHTFIEEIEEALEKKAEKIFMPMQPGDVEETEANIDLLQNWSDFKPKTTLKDGIKNFVDWYKNYYQI